MSEFIDSLSISNVKLIKTWMEQEIITFNVIVDQMEVVFGLSLRRNKEDVLSPGAIVSIGDLHRLPEVAEFRLKMNENKTQLFERLKQENAVRLPLLFE